MGLFSGILKTASAFLPGNWGTAASALGSFLGQEDANKQNLSSAQAQMEFQKRMSDTAHQREVKDLIAAGLNPMLSAKFGGASTPGGASATVANSAAAGDAGSLNAAQVDLVRAQTRAAEAQAAASSAQAAKTAAETPGATADSSLKSIEAGLAEFFNKRGDDRWLREKLMDADGAEAILRRYVASIGWNAEQALHDFARQEGFTEWEEMIKRKDYARALVMMALERSQLPKAEAEAAFYRTDFGKEVAPWISSAQGITSIAAGAAGIGRRYGIGLRFGRNK